MREPQKLQNAQRLVIAELLAPTDQNGERFGAITRTQKEKVLETEPP